MTAVEKEQQQVEVLSIGLSDEEKAIRDRLCSGNQLKFIDVPFDVDKLMELSGVNPALILCGQPPTPELLVEIAQLLRMNYQVAPIFFLAKASDKHDRKKLIKNGFTDVFFFPIDQELFRAKSIEVIQSSLKTERVYRSVQLVDLQPDSVLDFDLYVYLPANNKHLKYSSKGAAIEGQKLERLKSRQMNSVFVAQEDLPQFYNYTAKVLKSLGQDKTLSETERRERLKSAVRDVLTGLFNDASTGTDEGKKVVEDFNSIIKSYIMASPSGQIYEKIVATLDHSSDIYSHVAHVSTYATLFAIGLGMKNVEDIALAGLLHDIGLAYVPYDIQNKESTQRTPEEQELYRKHPEHSIAMIQNRKLVVSDLVHKIILQHEERFDGKGYPKGLVGSRICPEAQVLSFADYLDEQTMVTPGHPAKDPLTVINEIREGLASRPADLMIDPQLLKQILGFFPAKNQSEAA